MSSRKRHEAEECRPPKQSRWSEFKVLISSDNGTDAIEGTQRQVGAMNGVVLCTSDFELEMCEKQSQEESSQAPKKNLEDSDSRQPTTTIFLEKEVKSALVEVHDIDDISKNPMYNEVIITRMFSLCHTKYLKKFRLVCKLWYELTLQRLRSEATLSLTDTSLYPSFRKCFQPSRNLSPFGKFLKYIQNPVLSRDDHPLRRFRLRELRLMSCIRMEIFYSICAQNITHLQLECCQFESIGMFRDICFRKFPNLQKLNLANMSFRENLNTTPEEPTSYSQPDQCHNKLRDLEINLLYKYPPICWLELFSHYPNLTGLKVYNASGSTLNNLLVAITIIREHDLKLLNITDLDIRPTFLAHDWVQPGYPMFLIDMKLPLEKLAINFDFDIKEREIKKIFTQLASTLKKLTAHLETQSGTYRKFPFGVTLMSLEEFKMNELLCESIEFLKYTPNLKKLWISDCCGCGNCIIPSTSRTKIIQNSDRKKMKNVKLKSVVELRFDYVLGPTETQCLIETFPNVTKLRMPMDTHQFKLVCEGFKDTLIDLEVVGNLLDDCAITGLSAEDVTRFNIAESINSSERGEQKEKFLGVDLEGAVIEHPNLTDLINLRTIKIINEGNTPTRLKDCSAFYGFLKLARLESLHLASSMKERAQEALKAKVPAFEIVLIDDLDGLNSEDGRSTSASDSEDSWTSTSELDEMWFTSESEDD